MTMRFVGKIIRVNDSPNEPAAPTPANKNRTLLGRIGGGLVAAVAFLAKFKVLIFGLKFVAISWSFLLSFGLYALAFGWPFAVVLIFSLLTHELGHYAAFRAYGLPARLPQFVPFLGAFTAGTMPDNLEHGALIALAGPVAGLALSGVCYAIGSTLQDNFWLAIAFLGAFMNAFNMLPIPMLDGGRMLGAMYRLPWDGRLRIGAYYVAVLISLAALALLTHPSSQATRPFGY
jgi:Zn-dependent protease